MDVKSHIGMNTHRCLHLIESPYLSWTAYVHPIDDIDIDVDIDMILYILSCLNPHLELV
jgi:hypothetical protein